MNGFYKQVKENTNISLESRRTGCMYGLFIGDALAMPVHWYYDRAALKRDYGTVKDYLAPRNPHQGSILWRSSYRPISRKGNILHDQAPYWGKRDIHYHQFLKAGENTLNLKLCALLIESLNDRGVYDSNDYLERYISYMTTPGSHKDTYVEEYHRHFFTKFAQGVSPFKCGIQEKHIGGLIGMAPIVAFYLDKPETAKKAALEHLRLTHLGKKMEQAGLLFAEVLLKLFKGISLREALVTEIEKQEIPLAAYPFLKWLTEPDGYVVGQRFSTACYVEDSVPSVIYLALKYHDNPEEGLIANTNLGGDNAYRGAVLGAIFGVANGMEGFPERWVQGLKEPPAELKRKEAVDQTSV
jgi:ADP-ribosyl-[dinitrogen reductase] hydrolase